MLKKLAAIGLGAALVLSPVFAMAEDAAAPAATTAPAAKKPVKAHKAKHVAPKHKAAKKAKPAPAKTDAPKS